nr:hypothetical protein [Tanacetum cinerariifolium]
MEDLKQQYLDKMKRLINSEYRDEIKTDELKGNFNSMSIEINKKEKLLQLEQLANLSTYPSKRFNSFCYDDDDDEDYTITVTPSLSTEPDNSLSMRDEHLDTILATESNEFIKFSVENRISIPSESEGIPDNMCDVPFHDNSPPLDFSKDQFKDFSDSNDEFSSTDDDSFSIDNIEYVEVSLPDSELVSSEVMVIVISEVGGIDDNILLTIKDDILRTKLSTSAKGKQTAKSSKAKGLTVLSEMKELVLYQGFRMYLEFDEEISWKSSDEDDDDVDERSDDQNDDDDQDDDDQDEGDDDDQDIDNDGQQQSSSVSSQFVTSMFNLSPDTGIDSLFETTPRVDVQASTTVASFTLIEPTLPPPTIPTSINSLFETTPRLDVQALTTVSPLTLTAPNPPPLTILTISQAPQAPTPPTTAPSTFLQDLPNFGSLFKFNHRLKTLEANFFEFVQTNQFSRAVKVQVSKILPKIENTVNEQLEAEVLT